MKTDNSPKVLLIERNSVDVFIFKCFWGKVKPLKDLAIAHSSESAVQYLLDENNKRSIKYIFLELDFNALEENTFLLNYQGLYCGERNKPKVLLTTSYLSGRVFKLIEKFNFISKIIEKPVTIEYFEMLNDL